MSLSFAGSPPVAVTILTGFLGSGKTSTLRALLQSADLSRVAVLVNEFGELGVDGDILRQGCDRNGKDADILELSNGCICCAVADDFLPAMQALLDRAEPPERILIETSGLALPGPLVKAFGWPGIRARAAVDGVVTLVDASALRLDGKQTAGETAGEKAAAGATAEIDLNAEAIGDDGARRDHDPAVTDLFVEQLGAADLIVLNKIDLVGEKALSALTAGLKRKLEKISDKIPPIVTAVEGRVAPEILLGVAAARRNGSDAPHGDSPHGDFPHGDSPHDDEDDHDHDDFVAWSLTLPEFASREELEARIEATVKRCGLLRVKGFAAIDGKAARLVVQGVGARLRCRYGDPWKPDEARKTELVFIGRAGLEREAPAAEMGAA